MARHSAKHSQPSTPGSSFFTTKRLLLVVGVCGAVLLLAAGGHALQGALSRWQTPPAIVATEPVTTILTTPTVDSSATPVEVPVIVGLKVEDAKLVLKTAGLLAVIRRDGAGRSAEPTVSSQDPAAGVLAHAGDSVTVVAPAASGGKDTQASKKSSAGFIVCIDPGHQSHSDSKPEPIGPGSAVRKARITGGTTGATTTAPEYETVLQIANNLKSRLEAAGVTVVMTRETNDVAISNAERAQIANAAKADLFVRLHADSSTDEALSGISTLYPDNIPWTKPIFENSKRAATAVQTSVVRSTHAVDRGTAVRSDLAGFNYSTVPVILVAVGFPSNAVEDRLLVSPNYQDQLAQGLSSGILSYLKGEH